MYNASIQAVQMPDRIRRLPVSPKGFPVPKFVAWFDGVPDFRVVDTPYVARAYKKKLCWVCGEPLGRVFAMTLGPMCTITRTISEPPSHRDCAIFSAQACPFLSNPRMRRNENDLPEHVPAPGFGLQRNPAAVAVWLTRGYRPFNAGGAGRGVLFTFDDPDEVLWFAEGRTANRAEIQASIDSGYHHLTEAAEKDGPKALAELTRMTTEAMRYLPSI